MVTLLGAGLIVQLALAAATATAAAPAGAPDTAPIEPAALEATLHELEAQLETQRLAIAQHARDIDAQRQTIERLRQQLAAVAHAAPPATPPVQAPATAVQPPDKRAPDLPQVVTPGEFPGSIEIPGTETAIKIGGLARATLVHSLKPLGADDRFITSSIPVASQSAGEDARTTYTAAPSRINLEARMPTPFGGLRTFLEYDFSGQGNAAHLRHAFIQARRWIFGQTWSTFSDPEAQPTDIDFEGLNAISLFRQAQFRYTRPFGNQFAVAVAIENPAPDLDGAEGVNLTPDVIARVRWEPKVRRRQLFSEVAHVQAAMLVRTLRGEVEGQHETTLSTEGFGVNVSGVLVPWWDHSGRVKFATNNGWGIGRYIKDLEALGGQDAVYDPATAQLRALGVASAYVGYERHWRPWLQTALTYGVVNVSNLDIQPSDALKRTQRTSVSVTWNPVTHADLVIEFLSGQRVNKSGDHGSSSQIQAGWKLSF